MNDNNLNQNGMGGQPQPMQQPVQQPMQYQQPQPMQYQQPMQQPMQGGYGQQPMMQPPKKNNAFMIIVILLLVAIAGIGIYAVAGKKLTGGDTDKDKEKQTENKDKDKEKENEDDKDKDKDKDKDNDVATGQQYKLAGYIFTFPSNFEVEENAKSNCLDVLNRGSRYFAAIYVDPYSYDEYLTEGVQSIENDIVNGSKGTKISSKEETISGRKWYIVETVDPDGLYWTESFTKLDTYHTIVLFTQSASQNYNAMYSDLTSIADKVKSEADSFAPSSPESKKHVTIDHNRNVSFE